MILCKSRHEVDIKQDMLFKLNENIKLLILSNHFIFLKFDTSKFNMKGIPAFYILRIFELLINILY